MNKLRKKVVLRISSLIAVAVFISSIINIHFTSNYYLYKEKKQLFIAFKEIENMKTKDIIANIKELEDKYDITITYESLAIDEQSLSNSLWDQLNEKGVTLKPVLINKKSLIKKLAYIEKNGIQYKIFKQCKLKTRFLMTAIRKENIVFIIGTVLPYSIETIRIINEINFYFIFIATTIIIILCWIYLKKLLNPLEDLNKLAHEISKLNFKKIHIQTGDEIEMLANSINTMSEELQKAHNDLQQKNENLKTFIADITHEIKTPVSLIKAYSIGIIDELDDGTYLDVIINKADTISNLVDRLLKLSKYEKDILNESSFNIKELLYNVFKEYAIIIRNKNITISIDDNNLKDKQVFADKEKIEMVINNLINNAIKYTSDNEIEIKIENIKDKVLVSIKNGISIYDEKNIDKIWEPFYVLESSRNKNLSGTGLGLSIVKTILEKHDFEHGIVYNKGKIEFYIFLEKGNEE